MSTDPAGGVAILESVGERANSVSRNFMSQLTPERDVTTYFDDYRWASRFGIALAGGDDGYKTLKELVDETVAAADVEARRLILLRLLTAFYDEADVNVHQVDLASLDSRFRAIRNRDMDSEDLYWRGWTDYLLSINAGDCGGLRGGQRFSECVSSIGSRGRDIWRGEPEQPYDGNRTGCGVPPWRGEHDQR